MFILVRMQGYVQFINGYLNSTSNWGCFEIIIISYVRQ